jgi:hypothetical protein
VTGGYGWKASRFRRRLKLVQPRKMAKEDDIR